MKNYRTDNVSDRITSDHMRVYLARGRAERSKAFHHTLRGIRNWFVGH
ncbi:MAG: hypothetical protein AB8B94_05855 [Hyphomicrobiales bacterium]